MSYVPLFAATGRCSRILHICKRSNGKLCGILQHVGVRVRLSILRRFLLPPVFLCSCCECTCEVGPFADDEYDGRYSGCKEFQCIDPSADCVNDDDITVNMLEDCEWIAGVGNGYCDIDMNTPECSECPCRLAA